MEFSILQTKEMKPTTKEAYSKSNHPNLVTNAPRRALPPPPKKHVPPNKPLPPIPIQTRPSSSPSSQQRLLPRDDSLLNACNQVPIRSGSLLSIPTFSHQSSSPESQRPLHSQSPPSPPLSSHLHPSPTPSSSSTSSSASPSLSSSTSNRSSRVKFMQKTVMRHGLKKKKKDFASDYMTWFSGDHAPTNTSAGDLLAKDLFHAIKGTLDSQDVWTTKREEEVIDWIHFKVHTNNLSPELLSIMDPSRCFSEGFEIEWGRNNNPYIKSHQIKVINPEHDVAHYSEQMSNDSHSIWMSTGEENKEAGPVLIAFEDSSTLSTDDLRCMVLTSKRTRRFYVEQCKGPKEVIKLIKVHPEFPELQHSKFKLIPPSSELVKAIESFERQSIFKRYKFGLLYVRDDQTEENDMYSNNETSERYERFLDLLGDRITLQGWTEYRGGLDVKNNTTGTHSVYASFQGYEIMFHVATLLPFQPDDLQRVERKRHLGNDIVCIIFHEGSKPFDPLCLKTNFTNVFAVVSPVDGNEEQYRFTIANKTGVPPYPPFIPSPPLFLRGSNFRDFLLCKLINGERASMLSPDFKYKMLRTRKQLLADLAQTYVP